MIPTSYFYSYCFVLKMNLTGMCAKPRCFGHSIILWQLGSIGSDVNMFGGHWVGNYFRSLEMIYALLSEGNHNNIDP